MLGVIGRFGSSKGTVLVPNLIGLTATAARTAIESAGLIFGGTSTSGTSNSSQSDLVSSQSIAQGTSVEYETSISYVYYVYVPPYQPTITYGSCYQANVQSTGGWCSGYTWYYPTYTYEYYRPVYYDGVYAYDQYCYSSSGGGGSELLSPNCGYTPPPTCTVAKICGSYSSCSGGYKTRTCYTRHSNCTNGANYTESVSCCTSSSTTGSYSTCRCKTQCATITTATLCGNAVTFTYSTTCRSCSTAIC